MLVSILIIIAGLVALYFLYNFLFAAVTDEYVVLKEKKDASMQQPIVIQSKAMPALTEGGEYTVSFWMYVNDWAYLQNYNKHIISIGSADESSSAFYSLLVYIGRQVNTLKVRVHAPKDTAGETNVTKDVFDNTFGTPGVEGGMLESSHPLCDLPEFDMQKWVFVSVVLNGKTVDVYLDGKLARSCILPTFYRVPPAYVMKVCDKKGFGGFISGVTTYGYALNPDSIWKKYMLGPMGEMSFGDYLAAMFSPSKTVTE
jgi:hypothetical protein